MEIRSRKLEVPKTARYFILGDNSSRPIRVLFVLHGYGMDAETFAGNFIPVADKGTWVIAPEGLSRFYRKAFSGDVVASWMTRTAREDEIRDYIRYLDILYDEIVRDNETQVDVLGFSQGAATASRWVMAGNRNFRNLVLWAGGFAPDIPVLNMKIESIWNVIGNKDQFISLEDFHKQTQMLEDKGFDVFEKQFRGSHEIDAETLKEVWTELISQS